MRLSGRLFSLTETQGRSDLRPRERSILVVVFIVLVFWLVHDDGCPSFPHVLHRAFFRTAEPLLAADGLFYARQLERLLYLWVNPAVVNHHRLYQWRRGAALFNDSYQL